MSRPYTSTILRITKTYHLIVYAYQRGATLIENIVFGRSTLRPYTSSFVSLKLLTHNHLISTSSSLYSNGTRTLLNTLSSSAWAAAVRRSRARMRCTPAARTAVLISSGVTKSRPRSSANACEQR